jgi:hypothetical protein
MMGNLPLVPFETRLRHQAGSANEGCGARGGAAARSKLSRLWVSSAFARAASWSAEGSVATARLGPGIAPRSQMLKLGRIPAHNKVSANCG